MAAADNAQWLRDRAEIEQLAFLYARGNDMDASYFDRCLCDDVVVEYAFGGWTGREEHKRVHASTIPVAFTYTQHVISNAIIDIDGDTGVGEYLVTAFHGVPTDGGVRLIVAGTIYRQEVVRTPAGWRIQKHSSSQRWIEDADALMGAVKAGYAKHTG